MKISDLLSKNSWTRRKPPTRSSNKRSGKTFVPLMDSCANYQYLNQNDFLNELYPSSHIINSCEFRSNRPKYKWNDTTKTNEFDGYEEVERVSIGIQHGLRRHKTTHTFGNDVEFRNAGDPTDGDRLKTFQAYWDVTGMKDALMMWGRSFFGTGDSALYLYRDGAKGNKIRYKVFDYEHGDYLNQKGDIPVRMFEYQNHKVVETYDDEKIMVWVQANEDKEWIKGLLGTDPPANPIETSDDGWECIKKENHGFTFNPMKYHREGDVCWGNGQDLIERLERILSDLGENNRYYAFQILFLTGGIMNLPPVGSQGKVLASKSEKGRAEILKPADASNSFEIDLKSVTSNLWETTGTTVVNIEDLKGGDQSGAYLENLYFRAVQWSMEKIAELRQDINKIVELFAEMVGLIEGDVTGYTNMKISWSLMPFVPRNQMEEISMIGLQVAAGYMSKETAAEISPYTSVDEKARLDSQAEKDAEREAKPTPTLTLPNNIDNNLKK